MTAKYVFMAGIGNSEPDHWQSLWARSTPGSVWVTPQSWSEPQRDDWVAALVGAVRRVGESAVIVAHSLGCLATAEASADLRQLGVRGVFLVAIPDPASPRFPSCARGFKPAVACHMAVPALVVASTTDPYAGLEYAEQTAQHWNSRFVSVGDKGHINLASNLGEWEEGRRLLNDFVATL
ncbi:MAG TPA: alpha/beta hydrolase [Polyangiaceae bacterium]|nr:alpha/beta hydrolase [Polyangiaceae bacterium]